MIENEGTNTAIASGFPPHNVSPEEKRLKKWGLQGAKAIFYFNESHAPVLFFNDRDSYSVYLRYAFGEQDESKYKPALGINPKNQENSFLGGIRWQIKNFATKRIQATVSRVFARKYDPIATAIDPTSSDRKESFKASVKTWANQQQWLAERQQELGLDMAPENVDLSMLPTNDDDLNILMQDYKLVNEIITEVGIMYHLKRLDFDMSIKEKFDQYLTMLPAAGVWCGLDENNLPAVKVLNPGRILAPRSEFNDYKRIAYGAYIDDYTVAEFRSLIGGELTKDEVDRLVETYATRGNYQALRYNVDYPNVDRDVDIIQVMHFEIATTDEYVFLAKKDKYGNDRFVPKPYGYYRGKEDSFRDTYRTERKIHRLPKRTTYGGYWVVGSDTVFRYGERNYLNGELGFKLRATNSISGHTTCLVKQMIPCLDNLETYDKKIQQLVASAIPRGVKIDLFALRKASFKMNGKDMKTDDLIQMFFQTGVIVTDTSDSPNGDGRKPIETFAVGLSDDFPKYIQAMASELEQLDEIIGYNRVSAGTTLSPETTARVAQQMDDTTDVNLDHIFRADRSLCTEIYKALGHLHRESVMIQPEHYIPIIGEEAVTKIITGYSSDEIGIGIEARPTQAEWNQFYMEIEGLVKDGRIEPEDRVALRRFQSLKEAETYLKVVTRKRKQEKLQEQTVLIDRNGQVQQQSNEQAANNALMVEKFKRETIQLEKSLDDIRKDKDHKQKMEEIALQNQLLNSGKVAVAEIESSTQKSVANSRG